MTGRGGEWAWATLSPQTLGTKPSENVSPVKSPLTQTVLQHPLGQPIAEEISVCTTEDMRDDREDGSVQSRRDSRISTIRSIVEAFARHIGDPEDSQSCSKITVEDVPTTSVELSVAR